MGKLFEPSKSDEEEDEEDEEEGLQGWKGWFDAFSKVHTANHSKSSKTVDDSDMRAVIMNTLYKEAQTAVSELNLNCKPDGQITDGFTSRVVNAKSNANFGLVHADIVESVEKKEDRWIQVNFWMPLSDVTYSPLVFTDLPESKAGYKAYRQLKHPSLRLDSNGELIPDTFYHRAGIRFGQAYLWIAGAGAANGGYEHAVPHAGVRTNNYSGENPERKSFEGRLRFVCPE